MSTFDANTQAEDDIRINDTDNAAVRPIENEDAAPAAVVQDDDTGSAAKGKDAAPDNPRDQRASRLEEIAQSRRGQVSAEEEQARATFTPKAEAVPAPVDPETVVILKVRGENRSMTAKERDALAAEAFGDDVADLSEKDKTRFAQMAAAQRSYSEELSRVKDDLKAIKTDRPAEQPQVVQPAAKEPEQKKETPDEKVDRALEIIQMGGDRAEARRLMKEAEDERLDIALAERENRTTAQTLEVGVERAFEFGREKAAEQFGEALADPVVRGAVESVHGGLLAEVMFKYIAEQPAEIQNVFAGAGITQAYLGSLPPSDAKALYKDMVLKGHKLPNPAPAYMVAAKVVHDRLTGSTQPAAAQHPGADDKTASPAPAVDRSGRKEGLAQPERANLPRANPTRSAPPRTEGQRQHANREELRASRQPGAARR